MIHEYFSLSRCCSDHIFSFWFFEFNFFWSVCLFCIFGVWVQVLAKDHKLVSSYVIIHSKCLLLLNLPSIILTVWWTEFESPLLASHRFSSNQVSLLLIFHTPDECNMIFFVQTFSYSVWMGLKVCKFIPPSLCLLHLLFLFPLCILAGCTCCFSVWFIMDILATNICTDKVRFPTVLPFSPCLDF